MLIASNLILNYMLPASLPRAKQGLQSEGACRSKTSGDLSAAGVGCLVFESFCRSGASAGAGGGDVGPPGDEVGGEGAAQVGGAQQGTGGWVRVLVAKWRGVPAGRCWVEERRRGCWRRLL